MPNSRLPASELCFCRRIALTLAQLTEICMFTHALRSLSTFQIITFPQNPRWVGEGLTHIGLLLILKPTYAIWYHTDFLIFWRKQFFQVFGENFSFSPRKTLPQGKWNGRILLSWKQAHLLMAHLLCLVSKLTFLDSRQFDSLWRLNMDS